MTETRRYRLTIWHDDEKFDWRYELAEKTISSKHTIEGNHCVPVDDWPDTLSQMARVKLKGCEFVASNDDGDGMSGIVDGFTASGSVIRLDPSHPESVTGDDFGQMRINAGGVHGLPSIP